MFDHDDVFFFWSFAHEALRVMFCWKRMLKVKARPIENSLAGQALNIGGQQVLSCCSVSTGSSYISDASPWFLCSHHLSLTFLSIESSLMMMMMMMIVVDVICIYLRGPVWFILSPMQHALLQPCLCFSFNVVLWRVCYTRMAPLQVLAARPHALPRLPRTWRYLNLKG